nr:hypothetical protein [Phenylobacterium sp.]
MREATEFMIRGSGRGNRGPSVTKAEWLKARTDACNDTCPEAPILKALETDGPFARRGPS